MKRNYILLIMALAISIPIFSKNNKKTEKPNVLIIFPDQLRRYSAGFWQESPYTQHVIGESDPVLTPNIDNLAKNGVVFTNAISNYPLCSPYRGMMLTGMYPEQNGIWNNCKKNREFSLKQDAQTITDLFSSAGYTTSYFGKCHWIKTIPVFDKEGTYKGTEVAPGGNYINNYDTYVPNDKDRHHIDYFYQSLSDHHFDPKVYSNDPKTIEGKTDGEQDRPKVFSPKNEAHHIVNYLQNSHNQRNTDKPFCMIWAINPPHNPWNDESTDMPVLHKHYDTDKYANVSQLLARENADTIVGDYARYYFANVTSVDHYVGQVIDELKESGELDNTIVIFSSDHGEMLGSHHREGKNVMETEAIAIPFIVHWPEGLEPCIVSEIFGATDVLPTLMGLAGLEKSIPKQVEGLDFTQVVKGKKKTKVDIPESALLILLNARGIYNERYTLCVSSAKSDKSKHESYFYDNIKDPYQLNKLVLSEHPDIVKPILKDLGQKLKESNDPWYTNQKYNDIIIYPSN